MRLSIFNPFKNEEVNVNVGSKNYNNIKSYYIENGLISSDLFNEYENENKIKYVNLYDKTNKKIKRVKVGGGVYNKIKKNYIDKNIGNQEFINIENDNTYEINKKIGYVSKIDNFYDKQIEEKYNIKGINISPIEYTRNILLNKCVNVIKNYLSMNNEGIFLFKINYVMIRPLDEIEGQERNDIYIEDYAPYFNGMIKITEGELQRKREEYEKLVKKWKEEDKKRYIKRSIHLSPSFKLKSNYEVEDIMDLSLKIKNILESKSVSGESAEKSILINLESYVINPLLAGCNNNKYEIIKIGDISLKQPKSSNNNCLFSCIKDKIIFSNLICVLENNSKNITKIIRALKEKNYFEVSKGVCNAIRKCYGILPNNMIDTETSKKIVNDLCGKKCYISNEEDYESYDFKGNNYENIIMLFVKNNHFYNFNGVKKYCNKCCMFYNEKHNEISCEKRELFLKIRKETRDNIKKGIINKKLSPNINPRKDKINNLKSVLHYDIETHHNKTKNNEHIVYAVGCVYYHYKQGLIYRGFYGDNCMRQFINFLRFEIRNKYNNEIKEIRKLEKWDLCKDKEKDYLEIKYINAFNGGSYDHYNLINHYINMFKGNRLKRFCLNNGRILDCNILSSKDYSGFKLIDIKNHLGVGTLKQLGENLKCEVEKGDIDHNKTKRYEEMDYEMKKDMIEYLKKDCYLLEEIYRKYNNDYYEENGVNITNYLTASSGVYDIWKNKFMKKYIKYDEEKIIPVLEKYKELLEKCKTEEEKEQLQIKINDLEEKLNNNENKHNLYLPNIKQERFFRKSIYGGRCYVNKRRYISKEYQKIIMKLDIVNNKIKQFKKEIKNKLELFIEIHLLKIQKKLLHDNIEDYLFDADIVSLYPTAMRNYEYPVGEIIETKEGEFDNDKLGIYEIEYEAPKDLLIPILPRKIENGLKWDLLNNRGNYSSVLIKLALEKGYKIKFIKGYKWTDKTFIFREFVDYYFDKKKKATKGTALYSICKIFLNSLYGKQIQKPIYEKGDFVYNQEKLHHILQENNITDIYKINNNNHYVKYEPKEIEEKEKDIQKASQLGVFILDYSKLIMSEWYDKINPNNEIELLPFYFDTDSLMIRSKSLKYFKIDKNLGGIDNDINGKVLEAYFISPKCYYCKYITPKGDIKEHIRGKGCNLSDLTYEDYLEMNKGKSVINKYDFRIIKNNIKMNNTDIINGKNYFSLYHLESENTKKLLNNEKWIGRIFLEDIKYNKKKTRNIKNKNKTSDKIKEYNKKYYQENKDKIKKRKQRKIKYEKVELNKYNKKYSNDIDNYVNTFDKDLNGISIPIGFDLKYLK